MKTIIETQNRAQIMSLVTNGVQMYVSVKKYPPQKVYPLIIDNAILIPVSYKDHTWIERLGKGPKENISSLITIFFKWSTSEKNISIGELLEQDDDEDDDFDNETEEDYNY